jgi:Family of unknown function (DUF5518)
MLENGFIPFILIWKTLKLYYESKIIYITIVIIILRGLKMHLNFNFKAIIIGFVVTAVTFFVLGYFSYILGGLVVGFLIADDYMDGAINGAIAAGVAGLLVGIFYLFLFSALIHGISSQGTFGGIAYFGIIFTAIQLIIAGLVLGGIGGAAGIFLKEQIEMRNMQKSGVTPKKKDNGYLVCDKCEGSYKLQSDESPEDFSDQCECGGNLKYYNN